MPNQLQSYSKLEAPNFIAEQKEVAEIVADLEIRPRVDSRKNHSPEKLITLTTLVVSQVIHKLERVPLWELLLYRDFTVCQILEIGNRTNQQ